MKIYGYGILEAEKPFYLEAATQEHYQLVFANGDLNSQTVKKIPQGVEAVLITPTSVLDEKLLTDLKKANIKFISTLSVGVDHLDLKAAKELGFQIGRVPAYSPTSVASYAFAAGLEFLRRTGWMFYQATQYNFDIDQYMFAKELKNSTIGIIGTGRIGFETANYFHSTGAKVLGYDVVQNPNAQKVLTYTDLATILKEADLISLHLPHIKGENDNFVDAKFIEKMKDGASLINAARGPLVDYEAVLKGIETGKLYGFCADVYLHEDQILGKQLDEKQLKKINPELAQLLKWYPRVLISQHLGYFTDEAVKNMAQTSILNLKQLSETGTCETAV